MREEQSIIHGLELQARALTAGTLGLHWGPIQGFPNLSRIKTFFAVTSDTETVSFLVGTQSLRHTNLLYKVRQSLDID